MDSQELAAEVGHDLRASIQDQTNLLNDALGKARMLEGRQKLKDEAHQKDLTILRDEIARLEAQVVDIANGLGTVPRDLHVALGEKLDRALNKLHATRTYAEQQRALNTRWRAGAAAAMLAAGPLRDLLLETLPPAPPAKVIEGPALPTVTGQDLIDRFQTPSEPATGVIG